MPWRWPKVRWVSQAARIVGRGLEWFPLTLFGAVVLGVAGLAVRFLGLGAMDWVLLTAGGVLAGLATLLVLLVGAVAIALSLRARAGTLPEGWVEAQGPVVTGFALPAAGWVPLLRVRWSWTSHPSVRVEPDVPVFRRATERVTFARRGDYGPVERRVVVEDVLGLARVAFRLPAPGRVRVLPGTGALRRFPTLLSLAAGDDYPHPMGVASGDRVDLRRYVPGDSARFIHWKVFGRTRRLMVRVPERALSRSHRVAGFLVAGPLDEAAAAAARVAVESGALGPDFRFGASGVVEVADSTEGARDVIVRAAAGSSGPGLVDFVERLEREGPATFVVFAPPVRGPWAAELAAVARSRGHRLRVVIAYDVLDRDGTARPAWLRWLLASSPSLGVTRADLDALVAELGRLQVSTMVVERPTGRVVAESRGAVWRFAGRAA